MLEAGCSVQRSFIFVLFKVVSYAEILVLGLLWEGVSCLVVDTKNKHHLRVTLPLLKTFHTLQLSLCLQMALKKRSEGRIFNTYSSYNFQHSSLLENNLQHPLSNN